MMTLEVLDYTANLPECAHQPTVSNATNPQQFESLDITQLHLNFLNS